MNKSVHDHYPYTLTIFLWYLMLLSDVVPWIVLVASVIFWIADQYLWKEMFLLLGKVVTALLLGSTCILRLLIERQKKEWPDDFRKGITTCVLYNPLYLVFFWIPTWIGVKMKGKTIVSDPFLRRLIAMGAAIIGLMTNVFAHEFFRGTAKMKYDQEFFGYNMHELTALDPTLAAAQTWSFYLFVICGIAVILAALSIVGSCSHER